MKILIVHNRYLQAGGEDVAVAAESALLRARGHDVEMHETSNESMLEMGKLRAAAATVWHGQARSDIARTVQRFRPNVIHFHNTFPLLSPSAYYARIIGESAVVQTLHNYRLVCPGATLMRAGKPCEDCVGNVPWRAVVHGCYRESRAASLTTAIMLQSHRALGTWQRRVDAYIALTAANRDVFIKGGIPPKKLHVKPNFIDPDPAVGSHGGTHFLFAGRLTEAKGTRLLLDAWARLENPPRLRILGDGPLAAAVRDAAASHHAIEFVGPVSREQVLREMKDARAFIAPTLSYENFPFATCEAMATGLPVISADLPNVRDILGGGSAGLLFRPGDASELAAVVERATMNPVLLVQLGRAARACYEQNYTAEINYQQLLRVYESVTPLGARHA